ncbi:hypothetical protein MCB86_09065 [Pseudomonas sp. KSR10]|uniref:hypothetical protein n=1 Tax=Pseudomonas sp. KSR10 TaxID=2916654 RepID=UPI001EF87341|nr:hypothetical protein [Pseudomonas sp. KSR10]MCG6540224.1 hypothetical protein [Pseudomonas sp. KSR10]
MEPIEEIVHIPADAWAMCFVAAHPEQSAELEMLTQDYLAHGGEIHEVPAGVRTKPDSKAERLLGVIPTTQFSRGEHLEHMAPAERRKSKRDAKLVEQIAQLLPVPNRAAISKALGISDDLTRRLLMEHFGEEARGLLESRFDDGPALARVRQAIAGGAVGYLTICERACVHYATLKRLESKYRLKITKATRRTEMQS